MGAAGGDIKLCMGEAASRSLRAPSAQHPGTVIDAVPSVHRRKRRRRRPLTNSRRRRLIRADAQINSSRRRLIRVERPPLPAPDFLVPVLSDLAMGIFHGWTPSSGRAPRRRALVRLPVHREPSGPTRRAQMVGHRGRSFVQGLALVAEAHAVPRGPARTSRRRRLWLLIIVHPAAARQLVLAPEAPTLAELVEDRLQDGVGTAAIWGGRTDWSIIGNFVVPKSSGNVSHSPAAPKTTRFHLLALFLRASHGIRYHSCLSSRRGRRQLCRGHPRWVRCRAVDCFRPLIRKSALAARSSPRSASLRTAVPAGGRWR